MIALADIIIKNGMVITVDKDRRVLMDGAVTVENERIVGVGETSEIVKAYDADIVIDAHKMVVLPGLFDVSIMVYEL